MPLCTTLNFRKNVEYQTINKDGETNQGITAVKKS